MTATQPARRRQGRPRDPAADEAILAAVFDVIAERGFSGLTVDAVATRAGVGKATIYRRWPTREDLVIAAASCVVTADELPDTGSLRDDLVAWYWERYRAKSDSTDGRLLGQVIVEATVNPELKKLMRTFKAERHRAVVEMVDRARARGEAVDVDVAHLADVVSGGLMYRSLFGEGKVRRADVERFVDTALAGASETGGGVSR